ncbi:hypothetical protein C0Q70_02468 [Pomacea canaliculata]|uniref:DUF4371 domain-containing protein n=1 Tax=Pomacea canaliculata TaxID=400727 RepID=A0A2T7PQ20_POMCA|nr:hypothetical protein C0Q70_02468 [Pomacea canaliculata]
MGCSPHKAGSHTWGARRTLDNSNEPHRWIRRHEGNFPAISILVTDPLPLVSAICAGFHRFQHGSRKQFGLEKKNSINSVYKRLKRKEGESYAEFLSRGRAEFAALPPKAVWGLKRRTALTVFIKRLKRKEGESYAEFLSRGRAEFAALPPARVLVRIGAALYFEVEMNKINYTAAHDNLPRHVFAKKPLQTPSNITHLRQCVQKVFNDSYGRALGKEDCYSPFPYKKHFLAPVVKVTGMPEGVQFKHPANYGASKLRQIIANKALIKMELIAPSATEVIQSSVEADIGKAEFAALPPVAKKILATEAAAPAFSETVEEKKLFMKQLEQQLKKVARVLVRIGAALYFEVEMNKINYTAAHDNLPRQVFAKKPLQTPSNITHLRQCVQKVFNDSYVSIKRQGRICSPATSRKKKKELATEAAAPAFSETVKEKKLFMKQLEQQLKKVARVLVRIGAALYFEALLVRTQEQPDDHQPTYTDHNKAAELQASLGNVCRQQIFVRIKESPYIGIMLDESLDVAVQKKLVIFCRVIDEEVGQTEFAANIEVKDGKADTIMDTIMDFLHDVDVPLERVSGIGTDGAAVMVGRLNGVGGQLQKQEPQACWNLVCGLTGWPLCVSGLQRVSPTWRLCRQPWPNIFDFFHYSACRYNKLRELKGVDEKHRCSKVFQKDSIDIRQVEDMLAATSATLKDLAEHPGSVLQDFFTQVADSGHFQGITVTGSEDIVRRIGTDFVREIHQEMDKQFPANDMAVLKDLATVLDPSHLPHTQEEIREHGKEALERLLTQI